MSVTREQALGFVEALQTSDNMQGVIRGAIGPSHVPQVSFNGNTHKRYFSHLTQEFVDYLRDIVTEIQESDLL